MSKVLQKVLDEEYDLIVLAKAAESDLWQVLVKVISARLCEIHDELRDRPQLCDADLKRDIRHLMGGADRLKWVMSLPQEAHDLICSPQHRGPSQ